MTHARTGNVEFESTIKSGLPVYVTARIYPPEPDVGIFHQQVEIIDICWQRRPRKRGGVYFRTPLRSVPDALYEHAMKHDREHLETEALEAAQ